MLPFHANRYLVALATAGLLVIAASCGSDDSFGKRYPVSGTVTYNGAPLEKGQISFVPEDAKTGVGATGEIQAGAYALSTAGGNDGARAGKYKVTITSKEDSSEAAKAAFEKDTKGAAKLDFVPRQFAAKAAANAKSLIPAGYGDTRTTTLTAEVKEETNTIPFELSDAKAPPEPPSLTKGKAGRK